MKLKVPLMCVWLFNRNPVLGSSARSYQQPYSPSGVFPPHTPLFSLPQETLGKISEKQEPERGQKWSEVAKDHLSKLGGSLPLACLGSLGSSRSTTPKFICPKRALGNPPPNWRTSSQRPIKNRNKNKKRKSRLRFPLLALLGMAGNPLTPPPSLPFCIPQLGQTLNHLVPLLQGKANNRSREISFISKALGRHYK